MSARAEIAESEGAAVIEVNSRMDTKIGKHRCVGVESVPDAI